MGNQNSSSYSNDSSTEPQYADYAPKAEKAPIQRKHSTKPEKVVGVYTEEEQQQHGNKPSQVINDETFSKFIQRAKYKIRSMTNIGPHVENRNNPAAAQDVVDSNNKKEIEKDQFSHFIQNTRKKLRTVSTMRFKKGKDSDN